MKKLLSVISAILIILPVLTSCSSEQTDRYPLTVNNTPIDGEIFSYYLDLVWDSPEAGGRKDGRITQATYKCIRYVAINSTFATYGLSLTDAEKAAISDETGVLWNTFGEYYKSIGVSKETYLKIRTSEAYVERLRIAFFDKGGSDEISDAVLRGILSEEFVAFRYVRTPLRETDYFGNDRELTQEETDRLGVLYSEKANTTKNIYGVESAYNDISYEFPLSDFSYETQVVGKNDHKYTDEFYNKVKEMENDTSTVFVYGGYIYMVLKVNILNDVSIFMNKRSDCLKIVSEEPLQSKINLMCNAYQSVRDTTAVGEFYGKVGENR